MSTKVACQYNTSCTRVSIGDLKRRNFGVDLECGSECYQLLCLIFNRTNNGVAAKNSNK